MTPGGLTSDTACSFSRSSLSSPVICANTDSQDLRAVEEFTRGALRAVTDMSERMTGRVPPLLVSSAGSNARLVHGPCFIRCISGHSIFPWRERLKGV